jgi:hypothetical protein
MILFIEIFQSISLYTPDFDENDALMIINGGMEV